MFNTTLTNVLLITLNIQVFAVLLIELKWMLDEHLQKLAQKNHNNNV